MKDIDGQNYKTLRIGDSVGFDDQEWIIENLNVGRFRNGEIIREARSDEDWENSGKKGLPAWCYLNNDIENGKKYGKLYNWFAINDKRGLSPEGWHIPSNEEYYKLVGCRSCAQFKAIGQGYGEGSGKNGSGFSAISAGYRSNSNRPISHWFFGGAESSSAPTFWTSSEYKTSGGTIHLACFSGEWCNISVADKMDGYSVRCMKDYIPRKEKWSFF